ncbi:hypothetical protein KIH39_05375 [Telmatocola sphagniphila]|jgi:hypothetical protein|uniref:Uncharacterized protein n=1 Tax=Telmatocola sphagniphila TaxID=1123043 RepID=A0A8E6B7U1_9BACT|nr:hypothetical protein [Telmatocola sphagniphila]QVL33346.1 hypothetical protein KIH39_05375 [Telmatocola sphagniphila]
MKFYLSIVGLGLLSIGSIKAQTPATIPNALPTDGTITQPLATQPPATQPLVPPPASSPALSISKPSSVENWQGNLENHPAYTDPFNRTLIGTELYFRAGPSFILGGGILRSQLNTTGASVEGGGRSLFFNSDGSSAWVVDLGLSYSYNRGQLNPNNVITVIGDTGYIRALDRTAAQIALGKEWYPVGSADVTAHKSSFWKYGVDAGLRWGTGHIDYTSVPMIATPLIRHQDVFGGTFIGANADLEVPLGGTWSYLFGFRVEVGYTFSSLVPGYNSSLYDIGLLFETGLRF